MRPTTPKQQRFVKSMKDARAYRRELLNQAIEKIERDEQRDPLKIPVNWGELGDIEHDISLLEQLIQLQIH